MRIVTWKISKLVIIIFMFAGILGLLFMLGLTVANITLRELFSMPMYGAVELVGFGGIILYSASLVYCQIQRRHVTISILTDRLSKRGQRVLEIITSFISLFTIAILEISAIAITVESVGKREVGEVLRFQLSPFRGIWAFCCLLLLGVLVYQTYTRFFKRHPK